MTPRVRATWALRTAAEYRSAALAAEMLHWSLVLGLGPDIAGALHQLAGDELEHAELSATILVAAGGDPSDVRVDGAELEFCVVPGEPLARRALLVALREYALHESIALEAFRALRARPLHAAVRPGLERIFADEARHRRVGWTLLDALLARTGDRVWLAGFAERSLADVEAPYRGIGEPQGVEAEWGVVGEGEMRRAVARFRRFVRPRLVKRGLIEG